MLESFRSHICLSSGSSMTLYPSRLVFLAPAWAHAQEAQAWTWSRRRARVLTSKTYPQSHRSRDRPCFPGSENTTVVMPKRDPSIANRDHFGWLFFPIRATRCHLESGGLVFPLIPSMCESPAGHCKSGHYAGPILLRPIPGRQEIFHLNASIQRELSPK